MTDQEFSGSVILWACELSREFGVAESTVHRWATGAARPHPLIKNQIVRYIQTLEASAHTVGRNSEKEEQS